MTHARVLDGLENVHYPSDVLVGWLTGIVWAVAARGAIERPDVEPIPA